MFQGNINGGGVKITISYELSIFARVVGELMLMFIRPFL